VRDNEGIQLLDLPYSDERPFDDAAPGVLAEFFGRTVQSFGVSYDGGAIASNGEGLCATTREFLHKWEVTSSERRSLTKALGCRILMQLPALSEDETKHVDLFLQFAEPTVAVLASFDHELAPEDAERMDEAAEILEQTSAGMGWPLTLVRVPVPSVRWDGYRAYVNFVRLPGRALVPSYHDVPEADEQAAFAALELAMPAADLVRVPADGVRRYGGSLHCIALGLI
jgi:agmatine/peptidylarginine deiminase